MKLFPWRDGDRWLRERVDAYVDGELQARDLARLESALATMPWLADAISERRALKRLASALPPVAAPRSFAITAAMVESLSERAHVSLQPVRRARPAMLRLSQAGAGLAAAFFAITVVVTSVSNSAGGDDAAFIATDASGGANSTKQSAPEISAASSAGDSSEPPAVPTPAADSSDGTRSSTAPGGAGVDDSAKDSGEGPAGTAEIGPEGYDYAARLSRANDGRDSATTILIATSGALFVLLGGAWLYLRQRGESW